MVPEEKDKDTNKHHQPVKLEAMQHPGQPEVEDKVPLDLKAELVVTVETAVSEELEELVEPVVHGVLLEVLVQQVQLVVLELLELKVLLV